MLQREEVSWQQERHQRKKTGLEGFTIEIVYWEELVAQKGKVLTQESRDFLYTICTLMGSNYS